MEKEITGYPNYIINDNGEVYNKTTKRHLIGSINEGGYRYYRLSSNGKKKMFYAHRLVAEHFIDNPNDLPVVNHKDGNKLNNNIDNLEWTTYSQNSLHAHKEELISSRGNTIKYDQSFDNEEWVDIPGYEGLYRVSKSGKVHGVKRNHILRPSLTCGYNKVRLSKDGKVKDYILYKLVYLTFNHLDSVPKGYLIDHIDGDKQNDSLDNLRLVTPSENVRAAYYTQKTNSSIKAVNQFDKQGNFIATFPSCSEAARQLNLDSSTISKVCRGINKTHGGFIFKYVS